MQHLVGMVQHSFGPCHTAIVVILARTFGGCLGPAVVGAEGGGDNALCWCMRAHA